MVGEPNEKAIRNTALLNKTIAHSEILRVEVQCLVHLLSVGCVQ